MRPEADSGGAGGPAGKPLWKSSGRQCKCDRRAAWARKSQAKTEHNHGAAPQVLLHLSATQQLLPPPKDRRAALTGPTIRKRKRRQQCGHREAARLLAPPRRKHSGQGQGQVPVSTTKTEPANPGQWELRARQTAKEKPSLERGAEDRLNDETIVNF